MWVATAADVFPARVAEEERDYPRHVVVHTLRGESFRVLKTWLIFQHDDLVKELQNRVDLWTRRLERAKQMEA